MCTLIVLHRCVPGSPLVVAANRDEFLDRPAEGLAIRRTGSGRILSPLDLEAGGTWLGLSERGVFAGLTNLRPLEVETHEKHEAGEATLRSRGEVVMAALEAESAGHAAREIQKLSKAAYNPFQLLVADERDAWLVVYRDRPQLVRLEPGAHIVGNVEDERIAAATGAAEMKPSPLRAGAATEVSGFEGIEGLFDREEPRAAKLTRIRERVEKLVMDSGRDLFEGLAEVCREHVDEEGEAGPNRPSPFEATCVHVADRYGTRSSLLLELSEDPGGHRLWATEGAPCVRPFDNRSSLLKELDVRSSVFSGTEPVRGRSVEKNR